MDHAWGQLGLVVRRRLHFTRDTAGRLHFARDRAGREEWSAASEGSAVCEGARGWVSMARILKIWHPSGTTSSLPPPCALIGVSRFRFAA